jgi:ferredoxin
VQRAGEVLVALARPRRPTLSRVNSGTGRSRILGASLVMARSRSQVPSLRRRTVVVPTGRDMVGRLRLSTAVPMCRGMAGGLSLSTAVPMCRGTAGWLSLSTAVPTCPGMAGWLSLGKCLTRRVSPVLGAALSRRPTPHSDGFVPLDEIAARAAMVRAPSLDRYLTRAPGSQRCNRCRRVMTCTTACPGHRHRRPMSEAAPHLCVSPRRTRSTARHLSQVRPITIATVRRSLRPPGSAATVGRLRLAPHWTVGRLSLAPRWTVGRLSLASCRTVVTVRCLRLAPRRTAVMGRRLIPVTARLTILVAAVGTSRRQPRQPCQPRQPWQPRQPRKARPGPGIRNRAAPAPPAIPDTRECAKPVSRSSRIAGRSGRSR